MKRLLYFLIMATISCIPIYYIAFWEPETSSSVSSVNIESVDYAIKDISYEGETNVVYNDKTNIKPILRMGKEQIEENMSDDNKKKLKNVLLQLSTVDLNRIEEISKKEDESEATKEILNLLRTRLSLKEYKKIQEILVTYINFDVLE